MIDRALEEIVAPIRDELDAVSTRFEEELASSSPVVEELLRNLSRYRGKRLRAAEVLLVGKAFGSLDPEHVPVATIVEMIHTATLVHDDVLDGATVRRRVPSLNALHGNEAAVLLGDYLYARAFAISTRLRSQVASRLLAEVTRTICQGEIEQIASRFDFDLPEERYLELVGRKTASLHAASCELGARYAGLADGRVEALRAFGWNLGLAFQIVDDCLDLEGDERIVGKSLGTDVDEGKMTLPLIRLFSSTSASERSRLREIVLRESGPDRLAALQAEVDLRPGIEYALGRADECIRAALDGVASLPRGACRDALSAMAEYVLCRRW